MFVYVGTFTEPPMGHAEGLAIFRFNDQTGALTPVEIARGIVSPAFLAQSRDGQFLYAVNEEEEGRVTAFARDPESGGLTELNSQASHGASPCFISLDPSGRFALVANYMSGTVAALPIGADGRLEPASSVVQHVGASVNSSRQEGPHAHMIAATPDGRFLLATDLGADKIFVYELTDGGELLERWSVDLTPGSGPRHFAFSPDGRTLYVICELDSTIAVFDYDGGAPRHRQTVSTLPAGFTGDNDCAQIVVSPDGRFIYGSNRGSNTVAVFAVDPGSGELTAAGHQSTLGETPRNINLDPSGRWLLAANQDSDTIAVFRRDPGTGQLTQQGPLVDATSPVAILFV